MSVIQLDLSEELLARARKIAQEHAIPLEQVIAQAVQRMVEAKEGTALVEQRAQRGRAVDIKSILRKAPDTEPDASDRIE